jgi:hypothetical protein
MQQQLLLVTRQQQMQLVVMHQLDPQQQQQWRRRLLEVRTQRARRVRMVLLVVLRVRVLLVLHHQWGSRVGARAGIAEGVRLAAAAARGSQAAGSSRLLRRPSAGQQQQQQQQEEEGNSVGASHQQAVQANCQQRQHSPHPLPLCLWQPVRSLLSQAAAVPSARVQILPVSPPKSAPRLPQQLQAARMERQTGTRGT